MRKLFLSQPIKWITGILILFAVIFAVALSARMWIFNQFVNKYIADLGFTVHLRGDIQISPLSRRATLSDMHLVDVARGVTVKLGTSSIALDAIKDNGDFALSSIVMEQIRVKVEQVDIDIGELEVRDLEFFNSDGTRPVSSNISSLRMAKARIDADPLRLEWSSLELLGIKASLESVGADAVGWNDIEIIAQQEEEVLLSWLDLSVDHLYATPEELKIASVRLRNPEVLVRRSSTGELLIPIPAFAGPSSDNNEETVPYAYQIDKIQLRDGLVHIKDEAVEPHVVQDLQLGELTLVGVNPESDVDWRLVLAQGNAGRVDISGKVKLASLSQSASLVGTVRHVELPVFSGYIASVIGYGIQTGQLNADLEFSVVQQQLTGTADLHLVSPELVVLHEELAAEFDGQTGMPLPMALAILEDSEGNIALNLPVSGDLSSPEFSARGVLQIVASKALRATTTHYLKTAIFPQATLLSLAGMVGGRIYENFSTSPMVVFTVGNSALSAEAKLVLDNARKMMVDRSKLSIKLCAVSSIQDGIDAAARKSLADARADAVRDYLLKDDGIESQRVLQCLSRDDDETAQGRVELSF